eukprot:9519369-Ditylum_brightwellii.AAC.1
MEHVSNMSYSDGHTFTEKELLCLQPHYVYHPICLKMYEKENPTPDNNPTMGCSSSPEYYKKTISFFMTCQLQVQNITIKSGNPTKYAGVNDLISAAKG